MEERQDHVITAFYGPVHSLCRPEWLFHHAIFWVCGTLSGFEHEPLFTRLAWLQTACAVFDDDSRDVLLARGFVRVCAQLRRSLAAIGEVTA